MAEIVKQTLLRTGDVDFSATTATDVDQYLCVVDDRITKEEMAELFILRSGNPVPRGTLKQLGGGFLICDRVTVSSAGKNASLIWRVDVHWKEIETDNPQSQDYPTPNNGSTDPEDWTPTWSSRTQVVFEPASDAYYLGGYTEGEFAHFHLNSFNGDPDADPPTPRRRAPLVNSAIQPFARLPEHRRLIRIWTIRWLTLLPNNEVLLAENRVNRNRIRLVLDGFEMPVWEPGTALIDTVDLQRRRWGLLGLVEVTIQITVDPEGHTWSLLDQGTAARANVGDPDGDGGTVSGVLKGKANHRQLLDVNGTPIQDPVLLNGDGQPLDPGDDPVFGHWSDFDAVNFIDIPLLGQLVMPVIN